jgi:hypothetical protein
MGRTTVKERALQIAIIGATATGVIVPVMPFTAYRVQASAAHGSMS